MKKIGWFSRLFDRQPSPAKARRMAGGAAIAALLMGTAFAGAQVATPGTDMPAPGTQPVAPKGYTLHETIDLGGHMAGISGSGAMYNTMVNLHSGPRVLGETFELRAIPGEKHLLVDSLSAFSNGWGGDPDNYARMDFYKGKLYDFSGTFRRDRRYFDYDLLGNPNIPSGQSIPIGPASAPTGSYAWKQVNQSPFMYNTVRRMTDLHLTLLPLSKVTFRAGYSQNIFQGPSLTPSGYEVGGAYSLLLGEFQRNSTDDFTGAVDWKPVKGTKLTFEEQIDHYKGDSYFTLPANGFRTVQEPDGTVVTILTNYDSLVPSVKCNANSIGTIPTLSAPQTPGGLPVINPACAVVSNYFRSQPTRILYPTEIFRFQSTSIRNVSMNGDIRYTDANMSLPNYYENFQGLSGTTRMESYTAAASAKRKVTAVDFGIVWDATSNFSVSDQVTFSNVQQPGSTTYTGNTTISTPSTAGNETINYAGGLTTSNAAAGSGIGIGHDFTLGVPLPGFFGQKVVTNDLTGSWDGWSRATLSLTYRHRTHIIAEGVPHSAALTPGETDGGTVTIHQNGGVLTASLRPTNKWNVDGSAEILYADNVLTPVGPRQLQHYRIHTMYRAKSWATLSGAYSDMELHNNTNNSGAASIDGELGHVAHTRVLGLGAELTPNEHYALDLNYGYSDVYTATNICYNAAASATLPGAATPSGTACPGATVRGANYYEFGPAKDFVDAPTQSGSVAISYSPVKRLKSDFGYNINSVNGSRFYNDARDVAGSLVSTYQTPFVGLAWTVRPGWVWNAQYKFYGYGEGGPSGAPYCSTSNPTPGNPVPVVACNDPSLTGLQTGMTIPPAGETAPRNFHANIVTVGMHYAF